VHLSPNVRALKSSVDLIVIFISVYLLSRSIPTSKLHQLPITTPAQNPSKKKIITA